ncbi:MAG TPA: hypothetical protein PK997_05340 [Candidatus Omnitrophota bacterium]|nr:MAG: hypothetical protein BWY49_00046 [Candidatus Omnitrophica bacterium ADurb.Bin314]HOE68825.1 hypothetical protein [Candidatus Omnitrophota bacterium]HQB94617.1 hypothetical protein [Candidatus Omnitrophota bacterium]
MSYDPLDSGLVRAGSLMYGLVRDLTIAGHLVKCAARFGLKARNFDHAGAFMASVRELRPFLAVLDFDNLEVEAYKTLNEMRGNADFRSVPLVGFVSRSRIAVKNEAEQAGCDRIYLKTEFLHGLSDIITRYAK